MDSTESLTLTPTKQIKSIIKNDSVLTTQNNKENIEPEEVISKIMCDRTDLIDENIESTDRPTLIKYPELDIEIGKLNIKAMVDTGSNITCMNQELYLENKHKLGKIEELPLTGIKITTATGHKIKKGQ